jgi:hypothetical protein
MEAVGIRTGGGQMGRKTGYQPGTCSHTQAKAGARASSTSRLTTIDGSSLPASTFFAVEIAMRIAASLLRPALCGRESRGRARTRVVALRRLLVEHVERRSGDPARVERFASAASSTMPPRAALITTPSAAS